MDNRGYQHLPEENELQEDNYQVNIETQDTEIQEYNLKKECLNASLKFGCIFYFVMGLVVAIGNVSHTLDVKEEGSEFLTFFIIIILLIQTFNVVLIIYNRKVNANNVERTVRIRNNLILYVLAVPLMVVVVIYIGLEVTQLTKCNINSNTMVCTVILTVFYFLFLVSVMVLMVDQGVIEIHQGEINRFINKASVIFTIVGLVNGIVFYLTKRSVDVFKNFTIHYYKVNYTTNVLNDTFCTTIQSIDEFLYPVHIAFLTISISFLLEIFRGMSYATGYDTVESTSVFRQLKISFRSLLIGIGLIILPVISLPINKVANADIGSIVYYSVPGVIYVVGICLSIIQIKEIKNWERDFQERKRTIADRFLIWIGCFGQIVFAFNNISQAVEGLYIENSEIASWWCLIIGSFLLLLQVALQSIIINLVLSRKVRVPPENSYVQNYCPCVGLLCLNIGCLIITVYMSKISGIKQYNIMAVDMLHIGLHSFSISFSLINRLHGAVFFGIIFSKIYI